MTFVIVGFGKFGLLAMERITAEYPQADLVVVEQDRARVRDIPERIRTLIGDASDIIAGSSHGFAPSDVIVPMVPFNLAAEYLLRVHPRAAKIPLPEGVDARFPNSYLLDDCNLACSWADFICPDDCPESDLCTATGEPRVALYESLERISVSNCRILVQRSSQILPGVGGYTLESLARLASKVESGPYIIATSCKCHAILTGIRAAIP